MSRLQHLSSNPFRNYSVDIPRENFHIDLPRASLDQFENVSRNPYQQPQATQAVDVPSGVWNIDLPTSPAFEVPQELWSIDLPQTPATEPYKELAIPPPKNSKQDQHTRFANETLSAHQLNSEYIDGKVASAFLDLCLTNTRDEFEEYVVWNASLSNMRVCPAHMTAGAQYFYVEHRSFLPKTPGVTLRAGSTKEGRVLGVAFLDSFSTKNSLGVGDPSQHHAEMLWETLTRKGFWTHALYTFEHTIINESGDEERRCFEWHRTKNNPILDDQGDLVLVESGHLQVLAKYTGKGPLGQVMGKQRGALQIRNIPAWGSEWHTLVLVGWAGIVELSRRRGRQRRVSTFFGHI